MVRCEPNGCCIWSRTRPGEPALVAVTRRAFESVRGPLPEGSSIVRSCGRRSCVNPDHLALRTAGPGEPTCARGHPRVPANVVRHQDGRIAYCRPCRNERRRALRASDAAYARREAERQRRLRASRRPASRM